jgi:hypothetical protein
VRRLLVVAVAAAFIFAAGSVGEGAGSTLVLKTAWAKKFRNRLSIDMKMTVTALNAGKGEDGDVHAGSRLNNVGLPMVAEILNGHAPAQKEARDMLKPGAQQQPEKDVYGAWRLWFEHPPHNGVQCQTFGKTVPTICANQSLGGAESNPAHSFEVHPVFAVNGIPVGRSSLRLTPDNGSVKTTEAAIAHYTGQNKILTVVRSGTALTMTSITVTHNYARLRIRITQAKADTLRAKDGTVDGGFVRADIIGSEDPFPVLRNNVRMFYFRDSEPGDALDAATAGSEFIVLGMPRIDMDEVLRRTDTQPTISMPLPFEFVVVALIQVL